MTSTDERSWWTFTVSGMEGPFTAGEVLEAIRSGHVQAETLVCLGSEGAWVTAESVFPDAFTSAPPPTPPAAPYPPTAPQPPSTPQAGPNLGARVEVGMSVLLSMITLLIWWILWLHPRLAWYAQQAGRPFGNRVTYFWLFVGLGIGGLASGLILPLLGFPLVIAAVVFGCLLTVEVVRDQTAIAERWGWSSPMPGSVTTLVMLSSIAGGAALTIVLLPVTVVLLVLYFLLFFRNHNLVAGLLDPAQGDPRA